MKARVFALAAFAALLALSEQCLAHRVNVFAFVDGDAVQVECAFGGGRKVKQGKLTVTDAETGETLLEGVTDDRGLFRFRPPEAFLAAGHGLNIRLHAGEGHQDDWRITPEELRALAPNAGNGPHEPGASAARAAPPLSASPPLSPSPPPSGFDAAGLEAVIGRVVDEKLAPIKQALARREEPGLRDIVGGIGWILGLLGLGTYMKYRR